MCISLIRLPGDRAAVCRRLDHETPHAGFEASVDRMLVGRL